MDWLVCILFSLASAGATGAAVHYNVRQTRQPCPRRHNWRYSKWELPPPGVNLELYSKVNGLLNTLEWERNEARRERDEAEAKLLSSQEALEESQAEVEALRDQLDRCQDIVRAWTHPKMEILVEPRPIKRKPKRTPIKM